MHASFAPATKAWFEAAFAEPTPAQTGAWDAIDAGRHTLVIAPTGSGKTLAAFGWSLNRLLHSAPSNPKSPTRVLYISPLKALAVDVERNLRAPLSGITHTAQRLGLTTRPVQIGIRTGDTSPTDRRRLASAPPDILITTPESLYLMLTSAAQEILRGVETVIIDEIHAVAGTKRGAHLALSLERLDALLAQPAQRIGLSATVRPPAEVARFLGGIAPVTIVDPPARKQWDLQVIVPVPDMTELPSDEETPASIWPHVEQQVAELTSAHRSTIVFANSRRLAEQLTARLNELIPGLARAHHGSVSKEQRAQIEDDLKQGRIRCVVATSSLELGIDMGTVDLVIQIESPPSVASALQRVGRAGHQVGEVSRGLIFPKHRSDLIPAAVTLTRMRAGAIEALRIPSNPLDVLAQQIVASCALQSWSVDELYEVLRRAAPYQTLPRSAFEATLDLLAGRYPSTDFAELRPRLVWDRVAGTLTGRPGAQRLAVTSGGTIPDRGLYGVFLAGASGPGRRVGELDEEMVYESRVGDVFALGATSWRIEDITHDRVLVTPAPGQPGRLPFWKGDTLGRPAELGAAVGELTRDLANLSAPAAIAQAEELGLDHNAATNLVTYLAEQRAATGQVPSEKQLIVERFRDELGDWRLVVLSPYGSAVHSPWALAINARLRERYGLDGQALAGDDGIVIRIPDSDQPPPGVDLITFDPVEVEDIVTAEVGGSALFAARFRECAARALLLPRRDPGRRAPLWQQRQRAAQLLEVAAQYPTFPITLEAVRECLQDTYDVPALVTVCRGLQQRSIRISEVETSQPSPFARSLLFGYVASFLYEGDSPLAERKAAALALDPSLLAELLGKPELRDLLEAHVIAEIEATLQCLTPARQARSGEGIADLLRLLGPLTTAEVVARSQPGLAVTECLRELAQTKRVAEVRIAGQPHWCGVEDLGLLRDGLGTPTPPGIPEAFLAVVADPLADLFARYARTHGPFTAADLAHRLGLGEAVVRHTLARLSSQGRLVTGEFRPDGSGIEWCDVEVMRRLRRGSLAALRQEIAPVEPAAFARFLPHWQGLHGTWRGADGVWDALDQLTGCPLVASSLDALILAPRVRDYSPAFLDELTTAGELLWAGHGPLGVNDGWISFHPAEQAALTLPQPTPLAELDLGVSAAQVLELLAGGGAWFFRQLAQALPQLPESDLARLLWQLAWSGWITNDSMAALRAVTTTTKASHKPARVRGRAVRRRPGAGVTAAHLIGRWSLLPARESDPTKRAHAGAEGLLNRYGVVTRGSVISEGISGGFAGVYRVLSQFEEAGHSRRGYFVASLGAAQFGSPGAVDRLRTFAETDPLKPPAVLVLAATDPANPYGGALPWPSRTEAANQHRPGRKPGALVVLVDGELVAYIERGGRTLLTWSEDQATLELAMAGLAQAVRRGALGSLKVQRADGTDVLGAGQTPLRQALTEAGFVTTPQGLRLRAPV